MLAEFVDYVREHEKNLQLQFSHLDKNKDGEQSSNQIFFGVMSTCAIVLQERLIWMNW